MKINLLLLSVYLIMNIVSLAQDITPPATPQNVVGVGYEKHIDIDWWENSESDLAGYKIYRGVNGIYTFFTNVSKDISYKTIYIGSIGKAYYFKVSAYDNAGNESPLSDSLVITTHEMTDDEFLDMTERATLRYFYEYGHPVSGLARERLNSGETCTIGGSGFGVMSIVVGAYRGYISRNQAAARIYKISDFLKNKADKFHGAFPHWINGTSGKVIPFSQYDNGGDLIETSFMIQGLLAARQYFDGDDSVEIKIRQNITSIWEGVEWDWYKRYSYSTYLYWHWSPNYAWQMNMRIIGPSEGMIAYLLAIASPTHSVNPGLFYVGWASSNSYKNSKSFYGIPLYVGWDYGGPLFFAHYSFLGFDPRNKKDKYTNYFVNNRNHSLINRAYCIANPKSRTGYSDVCWGLTASDDPDGYAVHEPFNDNGTIAPTAAISSMPYTPKESLDALKHFYRTFGSSVWGEYGFKDAFNETRGWFGNSYLAIDQGPIICMIENYRSGLLWEKFMSNPETQPMLDAIGFVPDSTTDANDDEISLDNFVLQQNYPNPFNPSTTISFTIPSSREYYSVLQNITLKVYDILGNEVATLVNEPKPAGVYNVKFIMNNASSGIYFYTLKAGSFTETKKMILLK